MLKIKGVKMAKTKKNEFKVEIENQKQFEDRLEKIRYKLRIKDNTTEDYLVIDTKINGNRYYQKRRYNNDNKQEAFEQLSKIQQKLVQEFSVDWE